MAERYSRIGAFPQIVLLLILVIILAFGGLLWFDYLGLLDVRGLLSPVLQLVGIEEQTQIVVSEDILLLDKLRLDKLREAVELRGDELTLEAERLQGEVASVEELRQQVEQKEAELAEREVSLNEQLERYENRRAVLEQNSRDLTSMRPDDAVAILEGYDDQLLIDTLRITEELAQGAGEVSLVSVWLSRFEPTRAAELQRKMTLKPDDQAGR